MDCSRDSSVADSNASIHRMIRVCTELKSLRMTRTFRTLATSSPPKRRRKPWGRWDHFDPAKSPFSVLWKAPTRSSSRTCLKSLPYRSNLLPELRLAGFHEARIVLERQIQPEHIDLNVLETGEEEPIKIRHR